MSDPVPSSSAPRGPVGPGSGGRSSRRSVRLPDAQKALIDRAAALGGVTTSAFVVATLVDRARAVVLEDRLTGVSGADREAFLAALDDAALDVDGLVEAAAPHGDTTASGPVAGVVRTATEVDPDASTADALPLPPHGAGDADGAGAATA